MATTISMIDRFNLGERVLTLAGQGESTMSIARTMTKEGPVSLSQSTVSRWLKKTRQERSEQTRAVVQEAIKEQVPADMKALNEVELWLLAQFRGEVAVEVKSLIETDAKVAAIVEAIKADTGRRAEFGLKAVRIIEVKLRYAGILENPLEGGGAGLHPSDLDEIRKTLDEIRTAGSANGA